MNVSFEALDAYARQQTTGEPDVLRRLREETYRTQAVPQMIAGPLQGRFLALLTRISRAKRILEIGTFVGYSALCFAEALPEDGKIITIDCDPGIRAIAEKWFSQVSFGRKIRLMMGDASKILASLSGTFDLVYIDADKVNYGKYYDAVWNKVRPGGIILADNLLWSGRVVDPNIKDEDTKALRAFAKKVRQDERAEAILLTVRDGLYLIRKLS